MNLFLRKVIFARSKLGIVIAERYIEHKRSKSDTIYFIILGVFFRFFQSSVNFRICVMWSTNRNTFHLIFCHEFVVHHTCECKGDRKAWQSRCSRIPFYFVWLLFQWMVCGAGSSLHMYRRHNGGFEHRRGNACCVHCYLNTPFGSTRSHFVYGTGVHQLHSVRIRSRRMYRTARNNKMKWKENGKKKNNLEFKV